MDDELRKVKLFLVCLVLFLVSCYFGYEEIVYFVMGRSTPATVTKVADLTTRGRGGERTHRQIEFSFTEADGTKRSGEDSMSTSWTPPPDGVVQVRYTAGVSGRARLAEHVNWLGLGMFVAAMALVLFFGTRLWLQARAATRRLDGGPRPRQRR
jgi:hypothetical protein